MTTTVPGNGARFAARPIAGGGTTLAEWRAWARVFPPLDLEDCPALVLVAPHPDDETLGFGATASSLRARGVDVTVVSVSDGGGSVPGLSRLERTWLERDRRAELRRATGILGLGEPTFLGLPDGELTAHEDELANVLADVLIARPAGTWCAATWRGDGHPDHEVVGRSAATAVGRTGAALLEFPLWMWHWAIPDDVDVPWHRMASAPQDRVAAARKRRAVDAFETQFRPYEPGMDVVLPPFVLQRLFGGRRSGVPLMSRLPDRYFEDIYAAADDPWRLSERWYESRKYALTMAMLPNAHYRHAFEPGCSVGVLTEKLTERCDGVTSSDVAQAALDTTRDRLTGSGRIGQVTLVASSLDAPWPTGPFDLVVLSEVAYYLHAETLRQTLDRECARLAEGATVVAVHWRHRVDDYPLSGDEANALIGATPDMFVVAHYDDADVVIDVLTKGSSESVAERTGVPGAR